MLLTNNLLIFASDSGSPNGMKGSLLIGKGRLRTLSSVTESRKFKSQEDTQRSVRVGVYYTLYASYDAVRYV